MRKKFLILLAIGSISLSLAWLARRPGPPRARAAPQGEGVYYYSGQALGGLTSHDAAAADLDFDGDLDVITANSGPNQVWLNGGTGYFDPGQPLGSASSTGIALGDLDNDDDLDALVANSNAANQVWRNQGDGSFAAGPTLGSASSRSVALADVDGDHDLDAYFANPGSDTLWINQGRRQGGQEGVFAPSTQALSGSSAYGAAFGDLDGDGDLDLFLAINGPDEVWLNQGGDQGGTQGQFASSGQALSSAWSYGVALGDLDGDSDLDALTASWFPHGSLVWLNDGSGTFSDSGQTLGSLPALGVALGDLDGDDDLDAFLARNTPDGGSVWFNNGLGLLTDSGQSFDADTTYAGALADLDADSDLDLFAANFSANSAWFNGVPGLPPALFNVARQTNDNGQPVYYSAAAGDTLLPVLLDHPPAQALEVHAAVAGPGEVVTDTLSYDPGQQLQYLNLANPDPDPSTTYTLTLSVTAVGLPPTPADQTDRLLFVYVDGQQGLQACILCYLEWLGRFVGLDSSFGLLHHLDLEAQRASPLWLYYTGLFDLYAPEMSGLVAAHPGLLWDSLVTLEAWTPAVQALENGSGAAFTVTEEMASGAEALFDDLQSLASPGLAAAIQLEQQALDLPSLAGQDMDQVWQTVQDRRPLHDIYMTILLNP